MGRNKGCVLATRLHCARKPRSVTAGIHPGQRHAALVHAHPTQNEALGEAFLALAGKPLHAHN